MTYGEININHLLTYDTSKFTKEQKDRYDYLMSRYQLAHQNELNNPKKKKMPKGFDNPNSVKRHNN